MKSDSSLMDSSILHCATLPLACNSLHLIIQLGLQMSINETLQLFL